MSTIILIIQLTLVPALSPLGIGLIKKIKAKLQNRQGASIFQPYKNLWKLFHKDEVISTDASWIFRFAPYFIYTVTIAVGASIPLFVLFSHAVITSDLLVIIYLLAIGTFFLALAGMDTGSAFGGFGSSREMTISALAEIVCCGLRISECGLRNEEQSGPKPEIANRKCKDFGFTRASVAGVFVF